MYTAKNGKKKILSATGDTKTQCREEMRRKQEESEMQSRMELSPKGLLADNMENWLLRIKKNDPKCGDTAFTRILCTFETQGIVRNCI